MNIYFVRHGNPDYCNDNLTELGRAQAEAVAERLSKLNIDDIYTSPYGRARETAAPLEKLLNKEAVVLDYLHEVEHLAPMENGNYSHVVSLNPAFLRSPEIEAMGDDMYSHPRFNGEEGTKRMISEVYDGVDELLLKYGFEREGNRYKVTPGENNEKNIAVFSHAGTFLLFMGAVFNIPNTFAWHSFFTFQTGVTWINFCNFNNEGYSVPRAYYIGDVSHLTEKGITIS